VVDPAKDKAAGQQDKQHQKGGAPEDAGEEVLPALEKEMPTIQPVADHIHKEEGHDEVKLPQPDPMTCTFIELQTPHHEVEAESEEEKTP